MIQKLRNEPNYDIYGSVADLSHIQRVLVATVDGIDGAEFLRQFSCPAELAHNLARQFHLVNFAVGVDSSGGFEFEL